MRRYFTRKIVTYVLAFFLATTIDWVIPRLMPGNPVQAYLNKVRHRVRRDRRARVWQKLYKVFCESLRAQRAGVEAVLAFLGRHPPLELGLSIYDSPNR